MLRIERPIAMPRRRQRRSSRERVMIRRTSMRQLVTLSFAAGALLASTALAQAECGIPAGSVRILSNDFEALHVVARTAEECASPTVKVTKNQTTEHKNIQVAALTTNPATYTVAMIANNSVVPLLNA